MHLRTGSIPLLIALMLTGGAWVWRATPRRAEPQPLGDLSLSLAGQTMGGTWSVKLRRPPASVSRDQLETSVAQLLARLDGQMSIYKPDSDLSRFNRQQSVDWFGVPREVAEVVAAGLRVSEETEGAFDVTVAPLVYLWGFGPTKSGLGEEQVPSEEAIWAARARVGYRLLEYRISAPALRKHRPDIMVDLGGIAKGYAADAVAQYLDSLGITDYLISVGGEVRGKGNSPKGQPWRVGIETPTPDTRRIFCEVELREAGISTSGDYRNFFEIGGKRYCHEIDPYTGRPIENNLASVSVIHASSTYADAMATALMVLGPERGYALVERNHLAVLFIIRGGNHFETRETPEFSRLKGAAPQDPLQRKD